MNEFSVAIVGATGLVGREFVSVLEERSFPVGSLRLFASERSFGEEIEFNGEPVTVEVLTEEAAETVNADFVFFSAGALVSNKFAPIFAGHGAIVIDNSSAFRMEDDVPLVVPEVNSHLLKGILRGDGKIIANPNCSTIQLVPFLKLLDDFYGLKRVSVATYQAVSGAGNRAVEELSAQVRDLFNAREPQVRVFPQRIAFNLIPQIGSFYEDGFSFEERKMINESRKILELPDLEYDVTTVRVPVFYGHAEAVTAYLEGEADLDEIREEIEGQDFFVLMDDIEENLYPTPADAAGKDEIFVGRLRYGNGGEDKRSVLAWIVADNIRKGAALNAVQIAEKLLTFWSN